MRRSVDLQQIPFDAVERIEVLKDGPAIYGTDAVAGVVNVILRQQYTGSPRQPPRGPPTTAKATSTRARSPSARATSRAIGTTCS